MFIVIIEFLFCGTVIIIAGTVLTHCADVLADLTGFGRLLVGSILLAGATSLPELSVDVSAVRLDLPDMAVGDLLGSCLFNLLILAAIDMMHHSNGRVLSRAAAAHSLSAIVSISLIATAAIGILLGGRLAERSIMGIDLVSIVIVLVYVLGARLVYYDQRSATVKQPTNFPHKDRIPVVRSTTLGHAITGFVAAASAILLAGPYMADAAGQIAKMTGLGGTFVGTTLVAFSTSLPEIVASVTAVRLGAFDLAIGNVFGSNAFNMVLLLPLDITYQQGSLLAAVSPDHVLTCLAVIIVSCVAVAGQLYQVERRLRIIEPDALLMILLVIGAVILLYVLR